MPKNRKIFSVIPIGSEGNELREILLDTLGILQNHNQIAKIYCVYDGVNLHENLGNRFSKIETFSTLKKSGPAEARNIGLIEGFRQGCSVALLLDSDVSLSRSSLSDLLQCYNQSRSAIACPLIRATGETWLDHYHDLSGTLNGRYLPDNQHLFFGTTSCMLISEQVYNAGLLFSSEFPEAAGEDIDYCLRAMFDGFQTSALDHVTISHWYGYNSDDLHDWNLFQSRFERYGRGEFTICQKHPYYHFLVNHTRERLGLSQGFPQAL